MYMTCSICNEYLHDDEYEYFNGKDAYYDQDRVCDHCVDKGLNLLRLRNDTASAVVCKDRG